MRKIYIISFLCLISAVSFAQRGTPPSRKSPKKPNAENTSDEYEVKGYGITTNTNSGFIGGFIYRNSKSIGTWRNHQMNRYFAIEAVNVKSQKERSEASITGEKYIFDKQNYLFSIRPQYGREILLFKKYGSEGVGLSCVIAGGPSIGIEKPYYIKYLTGSTITGSQETVVYDPAVQTDINRIVGSGSLFQGIGESKIIPGVNLKIGFNLDINTFGSSITGFELGFLGELFARKPQIMASATNQQLFTSAYLTLYFGSKKNK